MEYLLTRLDEKILSLNKASKKALVAYLVAGDPDLDSTLELMHGFVNAGVDILEIGVPFTDPIAEGPIIQAAHDRALKNNTSLIKIFELVKKFRKKNTDTPIILMGYMNTFLANAKALKESHHAGTDAVLIVDLPGETDLEDLGIANKNLASISLIAPTTSQDRISKICNSSSGFIYYVTLRGVTGSSHLDINEAKSNIEFIRSQTILPVFAGFGIKTPDDAFYLSKISDGIVIGSSLVQMIHNQSNQKEYKNIYNYLHEMSEAINR
jgi:tryptophan synthase alpha chain